jgi:hypothetical protein
VNRFGVWLGLVSTAMASAFGCSFDNREVTTTGVGPLSPESDSSGQGAGELTIVPSFVDLGAVTQGSAARARLRMSNVGTASETAPMIAWGSGSDPDLTIIQNQCSGELGPGEQCDLRVQIVPSRVGASQGTLELSTSSGNPTIVPIVASGLQPGPLVIQPAAGSFEDLGGVRLGEAVEGAFTISNPGAGASGALSIAFNRPEFTLAPPTAAECAPGLTDLASGQSCNIRVVFSPVARDALEATLSVTSPAAGSRSLTLRGQGLIPAALGFSAPLLDFGGVVPGDTAPLDLEVENRGDEALTFAAAQLTPAETGVFRIADGNCGEGVVLLPGRSCRIQVDYRPVLQAQPSAGELVVATQGGGPSERIALQGLALTRGNLLVEALAPGQEDFGDVLVGQAVARTYRISNPTQQASGALSFSTRNGYELLPIGENGACQPGMTELVNGQSCTVQVSFAPSARGVRVGAITVDSPLAGAKSLTLRGRGVAAGIIETNTGSSDAVVNFGRVTSGSAAIRSITVRNAGDESLAPPAVQITSNDVNQAAAFGYESRCLVPLAAEEQCEISLRFTPGAVVPYAANLELVGNSGKRSSVLLLGEALEAGRLVLAPAAGESLDFGDVAVGSSATQSFTLTNPGGGASGALSVRTDDSQFSVQANACAQAILDGLGDGESCSFDVSFTPTTSAAATARLSAESTGSGETGVALTGRGRLPATLAATTTERDLGRANIGQPSGSSNQFTWTVNNGGDLASGVPTVTNSNAADFDIIEDSCSNSIVPGGGSCALTIVFAPDGAGDRSTRITVDDVASGQSVPLTVTGFGVQLAGPGETCVATTDCSEGVCTGGLCCAQECSLTCQSCATGQCVELNGQEPCGTSGGVCFGLEQCSLPAGGGCTDDGQCGGGLVCKPCLAGGSQCTAPDACCGGCAAGYQCVGGECGCPLQADMRQQIDCGGGVCALNRANACCPGSPPAGCNCDPIDNLCKECLANGDCTNGLAGGTATCNANRTCSYGCPFGSKECNGSCILNEACCGGCLPGQDCIGGRCGSTDGSACQVNTDCLSGACRDQFIDGDGDQYPNLNAPVIRVCGNALQLGRIFGRADGQIDCCDADDAVFPGATPPPTGSAGVLGYDQTNGCMDFDYDCRNGESSSGRQSHQYPGEGACINESIEGLSMAQAAQACEDVAGWDGIVPPQCGQTGTMAACTASGGTTCTNFGFIPETRFCF